LFPGLDSAHDLSASTVMRKTVIGDDLQEYTTELPAASPTLVAAEIRAAGSVPPISMGTALSWRPQGVATAPAETVFRSSAAQWKLQIDWPRQEDISDLFLTVDYQGDIARLLSGDALLDDDFYNGNTWQVGLRRYRKGGELPQLTLAILPLREDAPIFLEPNVRSALPHVPQVEFVKSIEVVPQYQLSLSVH
jgi:beta-galactosidase